MGTKENILWVYARKDRILHIYRIPLADSGRTDEKIKAY